MQQPKNIGPTFPTDGGGCRPPGEPQVESQRSMDPNTSIEDYNRVMLEYTQRRMSTFLDMEDESASPASRSSRSSDTSGSSGISVSGMLARQAAAPTSAAAARQHCDAQKNPGHQSAKQGGENKMGL
ncbi:uncharacterized protein ACLA_001900 [Aspergillus clavatus NRRL 1]|uniref:Uncharacterized protein n=1 Tax=Aspergillus clavatus (strain ATCC 1007 / CBS 513.65 / DSM 816 / NCTC 3887 / NRRL 1 / QM 1276 / 107) TaxID=344612 RepID=A1C511_ASPCL|nr:uncharacterized protein ACLA_001900 [Aspergillus clavatus NRRL 1]EAW14779.1 conserved hypothetical protein [Aspergillus clavatus NRRL 1]